ncbi:conserved hypothetical protein [Paecilomyces variotii No. 5]|uniref:Uncharacterized protein n=1 Tax=Byssochlamys spectabilis (strain No. 5 / NBRC 109023) TaxID=1356009 RepID=V5FHR9_BYSSN|nr:conserved hypothetical protein [Paecilomyces variotii No. 5]
MSVPTTDETTTRNTKTIAFFGATGGCANACLTHVLQAGYHAVALARTPSKLTSQLLNQGLSQNTLDTQLRIIQGDATDPAAVRETILLSPTQLVSQIVSGLGSFPVVSRGSFLLPHITLDNPTICESSTKALLSALRSIYSDYPSVESSKPLLTVISSTGLTTPPTPTDLPFLALKMYHFLGSVPHADKTRMEALLSEPQTGDLFRGMIIVRPSLLKGSGKVESEGKGWRNIRVGREESPAVGYTVTRADVGEWIFEEVVKKDGDGWVGEKVSLTS